MESIKLIISKDFTTAPGPRYIEEGEMSGEFFRDEYLYPAYLKALEANVKLVVDLDNTAGYATSFLEESFGGLIRIKHVQYLDLINRTETYLEI